VVQLRHYRLCQGLVIMGLAAGGLLMALMGGPVLGPVAVIFPPWWNAMRAVSAAAEGGAVLGLGGANFIVFVLPDETHGRERLWRAGAWLLLDPHGLAGCGARTS
jgi:hypothetical protein